MSLAHTRERETFLVSDNAATPQSFTLSGTAGTGSQKGSACTTDWVIIPCSLGSSTADVSTCQDRYCGRLLNFGSTASTAGNAPLFSRSSSVGSAFFVESLCSEKCLHPPPSLFSTFKDLYNPGFSPADFQRGLGVMLGSPVTIVLSLLGSFL